MGPKPYLLQIKFQGHLPAILSLYLEQPEKPTVRLWTASSSWSMRCNCIWAQARPWAGKTVCAQQLDTLKAPHHTLPSWGQWKGVLGPAAFGVGLGTAAIECSQPQVALAPGTTLWPVLSTHPPAQLLG